MKKRSPGSIKTETESSLHIGWRPVLESLRRAVPLRSTLFPIAASISLLVLARYSLPIFHVVAEGIAIIIGLIMFAVAWNTYRYSPKPYFILLANGFFWISVIGTIHAAAYNGINVIPKLSVDELTQLWIAARYIEAFLLLCAPWFVRKPISLEGSFFSLGVLALIPVGAIFTGHFPSAFFEGTGFTTFKILSEYMISLLLFGAVIHMWWRRTDFAGNTLAVMTLAIAATMLSNLIFTIYVDAFGLSNIFGHLFKLWAIWLIYLAIVEIMLAEPYTQLIEKNQELLLNGLALTESERQKDLILHTLPDLVWLKDADGNYLACNPAFERFFGAKEHEIVGKTDHDFVDKELADSFRKYDLAAMHANKPASNEEAVQFADDGRIVDLETIKTPMKDKDGRILGILGIGRDITKRKRTERELEEANRKLQSLSVTDQLTGLLNRRQFEKTLISEINRTQRDGKFFFCIMFDIDHFKNLNDSYGHAGGDAALRRLGKCVNNLCQRSGDFAFRVGGEEFVVITSSFNEEDGVAFAELIRTTIMNLNIPNVGSSVSDVLTVSVGVSMVTPDQRINPDEVYKTADKHLYEAKKSGRNRTIW